VFAPAVVRRGGATMMPRIRSADLEALLQARRMPIAARR
jgi:hypothetical protein